MKHVKTVEGLRGIVNSWRSSGLRVGLVPTMGYLHEGHLSLMRCAKKNCDRVIATIFVNPMQFGPNEDLDAYPRDLERDSRLATETGVDVLFCPPPEEIYTDNYQTLVRVEKLSRGLCGGDRPGHFDGVATVVSKLFNITNPHVAVFGMKDFQQLSLIRQLVKDLNFDIEIIGHPIVRESDGLAMSSRNKYLSAEEREVATCLYKSILAARDMYKKRDGVLAATKVEEVAVQRINSHSHCSVDYAKVIHETTLEPVTNVDKHSVLTLAVKVGGKVRLIDNGYLDDEQNFSIS